MPSIYETYDEKVYKKKSILDPLDTYNLESSMINGYKETLWYMPELHIIHKNYQAK